MKGRSISSLLLLVVTLTLCSVNTAAASGRELTLATCPPPEPPSSFWGAVIVGGAPAPAGVSLTAWIDGTKVGTATTRDSGGATYYIVDVPERASDSGTGAVCRQGGAASETVYFALCDVLQANQQGAWNGGALARLDLTVSGSCSDPASVPATPDVAIRRSQADPDDLELIWPAVAVDTTGQALAVARYDVWRSTSPYFGPWTAPYGVVHGGDPVIFLDDGALAGGSNTFYVVKAISVIGHASPADNRVGAFSFDLVPGF